MKESMAHLTEILVPLDGSEASVRAVPVAGRLARRLGLEISLFTGSEIARQRESLQGVADEYLPGMAVSIEVSEPQTPSDAIIAAAADNALVCMATAASLLPHQGHVGSVAEGVVRGLRRPVALVGPKMEPKPGENTQRVIVPVDGSRLSEAAIALAAALAASFGVALWIVTVVSPKDQAAAEAELGGMPYVGESSYVAGLATRARRKHGIDVEFEVLHGKDPAHAIVDFAGDDGTIFMTTHGRSGLSRLFAGSVATGVVAHSQRAVFVWRPEEG